MDEVKILNRVDMLKALYNSYLQNLIENEIKLEFYQWKKENLTNGQDPKKNAENIINADRNVQTYTKWLEIIQLKIDAFEKKN